MVIPTEAYAAMFGYDENVTKQMAKTEGGKWDNFDPLFEKASYEAELKGQLCY